MKVAGMLAFALLCFIGHSLATNEQQSPISRIVKMLQDLAAQTKKEGKAEEELYDNFVCWAKSIISQKTASNAAATARIDTLEAYVADIEAGRIEFTTERADLEKELAELNSAIEAASALRAKEHQEFLAAEADMKKAVTALGKAVEVLAEAAEGHLHGTFLAQGAARGFLARAQESAALAQAADLGDRVLKAGDAIFLRRLLTGEVPEVDWNKLNRQATFKEGYKARSLEIQDVLVKLKGSFETNLKEAQDKEAHEQEIFEKLMETQSAQKERTEEAYRQLDAENGAKAAAKAEATAEVDALKEQVKNDELFIEQTQTSLQEKKEEWAERSSLRAAELAAFAKAIEILHSDDARDLMKRSLKSQGYSFLQESQRRDVERRLDASAALLRRVGGATADSRVSILALRVSAGSASHFTEVVKAIETLVRDLEAEEREDLLKKEQCEEDRAKDAREAVLASRAVDEATDTIARLQAEVRELEGSIAEKRAAAEHANQQLEQATKAREAEHAEWEESEKDDKEAAATVQRAVEVLKSFYAENKLVLVQQPVEVAAGQAPPPPPSTWEAPYGGKPKEAGSIIETLETAAADILKDAALAEAAEEKAQAEYEKMKADTEAVIAALEGSISELGGVKGDKENEISEHTVGRSDKKGELGAVIARIKNAEPGCDFIAVNYQLRVKNRQIEIDGLHKAKTILSGGTFDAPDPNRELKPGDALVQK